ncbi:sigma-E factor negative regulatory protein [Azohydromonas caseinilytica]|uniref:Sigma-E factor negative regulatory protein n=1 Tax=Azohydromonas caseinilytica TaxID=2728836 RepID=A0A848F644_9BURK|nr:sigma-E factor negative regulatory protein [Azohydromonas caseinilytica]NML15054.1 sigma-E factor negative regulatory protein [Azohydromonas caseinilytica]
MPDDRHDFPQPEQALSALMDGELDAAAAARLAESCRSDARLRATWHSYHLIGDVMRSQDLAQQPDHDAAFVQRLRERLAAEPVLLAPAPVQAPERRRIPRRAWAASAVAAGFMAVGGMLVLTRVHTPEPQPAGQMLAVAQPAQSESQLPASVNTPVAVPVVQADDRLLRDARLDRYLVAHKEWGSSFAMSAVPVAARGAAAQR